MPLSRPEYLITSARFSARLPTTRYLSSSSAATHQQRETGGSQEHVVRLEPSHLDKEPCKSVLKPWIVPVEDGLPRAIGGSETVADVMQTWIDEADVDGFNITYATTPQTFEEIVKYLWPELRRKGLRSGSNPKSQTMRETFLQDGEGPLVRSGHPAENYR